MFARLGHLLLIVALLFATGTHWLVLQSVAWAGMLASNARTESFQAAMEKTFDGKHPCALCKQISAGKQTERKSDFQGEFKKLEFVNEAVAVWFQSPADFQRLPQPDVPARLLAEAPPVPPPRSFLFIA